MTQPNPVLMVTLNNQHLTRLAVRTVHWQTLNPSPYLFVIDNGSTDNTPAWLHQRGIDHSAYPATLRQSLSHVWNVGLNYLFSLGAQHVLVVNNDILLPPNLYGDLLSDPAGFVTGVGDSSESLKQSLLDRTAHAASNRRPHPDFSCFLIRKWVWDAIGPFDENFKGAFCEDLDYHLRMNAVGIEAVSAGVPFWHYASATIKSADPQFRNEILRNAEANRAYFLRKWKVPVPTPENGGVEYYRLFGQSSPESSPSEQPREGLPD